MFEVFVGLSISFDIETIAKAVREIDGGCAHCICGFLNKVPLNGATLIADYINKNDPVYGDCKLILEADGWSYE